jgi:hypothetical protein
MKPLPLCLTILGVFAIPLAAQSCYGPVPLKPLNLYCSNAAPVCATNGHWVWGCSQGQEPAPAYVPIPLGVVQPHINTPAEAEAERAQIRSIQLQNERMDLQNQQIRSRPFRQSKADKEEDRLAGENLDRLNASLGLIPQPIIDRPEHPGMQTIVSGLSQGHILNCKAKSVARGRDLVTCTILVEKR